MESRVSFTINGVLFLYQDMVCIFCHICTPLSWILAHFIEQSTELETWVARFWALFPKISYQETILQLKDIKKCVPSYLWFLWGLQLWIEIFPPSSKLNSAVTGNIKANSASLLQTHALTLCSIFHVVRKSTWSAVYLSNVDLVILPDESPSCCTHTFALWCSLEQHRNVALCSLASPVLPQFGLTMFYAALSWQGKSYVPGFSPVYRQKGWLLAWA